MKIVVKQLCLCLVGLSLATAQCGGGQKKKVAAYKTPDQISAEINRLNSVTYMDYSFEEPLYFGTDQRNDLRMVIIRECRNGCKESLYFLIYEDVSEENCRALQGSPLYRISSDLYIGCEPPFFTPGESVE